jgi:gas vesicle protein GvpA/GvpJ/GvpM family
VNEIDSTDIPLADIVDRLLERGVVLAGAAVISVAGVELVELRLNVVLASVDTMRRALGKAVTP